MQKHVYKKKLAWRIQKKNAELSEVIEKLKSKNLMNRFAIINKSTEVKLQSRKSKYSPEVQKIALHLHFIGPRGYNFVGKTFMSSTHSNISSLVPDRNLFNGIVKK